MKSNIILMNAFSKTNYIKRRIRRNRKIKPKPKPNKKNKVIKKRKKNKNKKVKKTKNMSNVLKTLTALYPDVNIKQLNNHVGLNSLFTERELTDIMSVNSRYLLRIPMTIERWTSYRVPRWPNSNNM